MHPTNFSTFRPDEHTKVRVKLAPLRKTPTLRRRPLMTFFSGLIFGTFSVMLSVGLLPNGIFPHISCLCRKGEIFLELFFFLVSCEICMSRSGRHTAGQAKNQIWYSFLDWSFLLPENIFVFFSFFSSDGYV